ncbi:hypothetical protein B0T19DRAFT_37102 [Cercophora scortea]|uniref:Uncharacterized protein n=1 Tax=Cercophora scortea TaxID=314031 RepID=A0AAE0J3Q7_9PEZI|nr:hypothetical protein B0T19DRAFT_37102 [Cercophora scortea]
MKGIPACQPPPIDMLGGACFWISNAAAEPPFRICTPLQLRRAPPKPSPSRGKPNNKHEGSSPPRICSELSCAFTHLVQPAAITAKGANYTAHNQGNTVVFKPWSKSTLSQLPITKSCMSSQIRLSWIDRVPSSSASSFMPLAFSSLSLSPKLGCSYHDLVASSTLLETPSAALHPEGQMRPNQSCLVCSRTAVCRPNRHAQPW